MTRKEQTNEDVDEPVDVPVNAPEAPKVKTILFRSYDKGLTVVKESGGMEKINGIPFYHPGIMVHFIDGEYRIEDTEDNKPLINWMRKHGQYGLSFKEVAPADENVKPSIEDMEQMSQQKLREVCEKFGVQVSMDASRETIILAILKK